MKLKLFSLAALVLVTTITPRSSSAQYLNPKIARKEVSIRNVVILPAKVEIVKQSMKGPEGMAAESDVLSTRITQLVTEALQAKHISTLPFAGSGDADPQKKYTLADMQSRYDDLLPKIAKKQKDVKQGRFTLGDEVLNLNLDKTADAIVFIRGQGQKLTKGKTAYAILNPFSFSFPYLLLTIGIVDAHSGGVLVFTAPVAAGDVTNTNEKPLRRAIEKSLKKIPPGS